MFVSAPFTQPAHDEPPSSTTSGPSHCQHCGNPLASGAQDAFCCSGCRTVHASITQAGLFRYYDLKDAVIVPPTALPDHARLDKNWLLPLQEQLAQAQGTIEIPLKLHGLRCAACVWLIQQLFAQQPGAQRISINSARGSARLCVDRRFPLAEFVDGLQRFGYVVGDVGDSDSGDDSLLLRMGIGLALSLNAMLFSAAIYFGLHEGPVYKLLHGLNFACASLAVLIGAPVFMSSAWAALRRGILHLDLPISVGIALSYAAALWSFVTGQDNAAYYDSLASFVALMLVGRWLKERIVLRNRRELLTNSGMEGLLVRRLCAGEVVPTAVTELKPGDVLIIPPGDLVPVPGVLQDARASCSLDWINGESEPSAFASGELIPAGAFNAGASALQLTSDSDFASSELVELLGQDQLQERQDAGDSHSFSLWYVSAVLLTGALAFGYWARTTGSTIVGLEVMTAIYVVTCPCAIGVAVPLAEELVLSGLRRAGLFVRAPSFLGRALAVRRLVFDKTGTLTTGRLRLADPHVLATLDANARDVLYSMVVRSGHPKSVAVAQALASAEHGATARWLSDLEVVEHPGQGLESRHGDHTYRVGSAAWAECAATALQSASAEDLYFSRDSRSLCTLATRECLRRDAKQELQALAEDGYETFILSGDRTDRVHKLAQELGMDEGHALGQRSPKDKAAFIAAHDRADMLMIGDGVNDSLAVAQAFTSGTPSIDRAVMPSRTDFYFVTAGLAPIRLALRAAQKLARVTQRNLVFAVSYNVLVVIVASLGLMRPWLAAVLMPLSSVVVLTTTSLSLSSRSSLWKY